MNIFDTLNYTKRSFFLFVLLFMIGHMLNGAAAVNQYQAAITQNVAAIEQAERDNADAQHAQITTLIAQVSRILQNRFPDINNLQAGTVGIIHTMLQTFGTILQKRYDHTTAQNTIDILLRAIANIISRAHNDLNEALTAVSNGTNDNEKYIINATTLVTYILTAHRACDVGINQLCDAANMGIDKKDLNNLNKSISPLLFANFDTNLKIPHIPNAADKANQLIKQSYISPEMQWSVVEIFPNPELTINLNDIQTGPLKEIDQIIPQVNLAGDKTDKLTALHTALQAVNIAIWMGDTEVFYQDNFDTAWLTSGGMDPKVKMILEEKKTILQNKIKQLSPSGIWAWLPSLSTRKIDRLQAARIVREITTSNTLRTNNINTIKKIIESNNYKMMIDAAGQAAGSAAADMLFKQFFIAYQHPINQNIIRLYKPNAINQNTFTNDESLDLYQNFPSVEKLEADITTFRNEVLTNQQKKYIHQLILNIRQALTLALYVANKNSSYNIGYGIGSLLAQNLDAISTRLQAYDALCKPLSRDPFYGATDESEEIEETWDRIPQIAAGAAAAIGLYALWHDVGYLRSNVLGDWTKSSYARDEKNEYKTTMQLQKLETQLQKDQAALKKARTSAELKKLTSSLESTKESYMQQMQILDAVPGATAKKESIPVSFINLDGLIAQTHRKIADQEINDLTKQIESLQAILPVTQDPKIVQKEIAAKKIEEEKAVQKFNQAIDDQIKATRKANKKLTAEFIKKPTEQLAKEIERNKQLQEDLPQQKIAPSKSQTSLSQDYFFSLTSAPIEFLKKVSPQNLGPQEVLMGVSFIEPNDRGQIVAPEKKTLTDHVESAKDIILEYPKELGSALATSAVGLKAKSMWNNRTVPQPTDPVVTAEQTASKIVPEATGPTTAKQATVQAARPVTTTTIAEQKALIEETAKQATAQAKIDAENVRRLEQERSTATKKPVVQAYKPIPNNKALVVVPSQAQKSALRTAAKGGLKGAALGLGTAAVGTAIDYYARENLGFTDNRIDAKTLQTDFLSSDIPGVTTPDNTPLDHAQLNNTLTQLEKGNASHNYGYNPPAGLYPRAS